MCYNIWQDITEKLSKLNKILNDVYLVIKASAMFQMYGAKLRCGIFAPLKLKSNMRLASFAVAAMRNSITTFMLPPEEANAERRLMQEIIITQISAHRARLGCNVVICVDHPFYVKHPAFELLEDDPVLYI